MANISPAKLPRPEIDEDALDELHTNMSNMDMNTDSQYEHSALPAQPAAATPYISPITICTLPTDVLYMIAQLLNVFDVARLATALGEAFDHAASLYFSLHCRHFIAYPFSELDQTQCLRDNHSVLTVAANHIEEMTITYISIDHCAQRFNCMLKSVPLTRLRRLNITLRCPSVLGSGMEFPTMFGLEALRFSHFRSTKLMGEIIDMNTATLRVLEFDDVPELDDLPPLPEFLTQLMLRKVQTVAIDTLIYCLTSRVTHSGLTHFEYTAGEPAASLRTHTVTQYRKLFDVLRATVHTMTLDSWLLPFALDKRNTAVRVLCVRLTKFCLRLESTLDRVTAQMVGLEHLTITSCHEKATFEGEPGQYAELFGRLKSLTLVNFGFLDEQFVRYVGRLTKLTMRTEEFEPAPLTREDVLELGENGILPPEVIHPYVLPPGGFP